MGVIRHVDAGYGLAADVARRTGVRIPMNELSRTSSPLDDPTPEDTSGPSPTRWPAVPPRAGDATDS